MFYQSMGLISVDFKITEISETLSLPNKIFRFNIPLYAVPEWQDFDQ